VNSKTANIKNDVHPIKQRQGERQIFLPYIL